METNNTNKNIEVIVVSLQESGDTNNPVYKHDNSIKCSMEDITVTSTASHIVVVIRGFGIRIHTTCDRVVNGIKDIFDDYCETSTISIVYGPTGISFIHSSDGCSKSITVYINEVNKKIEVIDDEDIQKN